MTSPATKSPKSAPAALGIAAKFMQVTEAVDAFETLAQDRNEKPHAPESGMGHPHKRTSS
jgi:hypothetical protein